MFSLTLRTTWSVLKEDIDMKAQKFEHIDYYDALLRDGISKEIAVAMMKFMILTQENLLLQ